MVVPAHIQKAEIIAVKFHIFKKMTASAPTNYVPNTQDFLFIHLFACVLLGKRFGKSEGMLSDI